MLLGILALEANHLILSDRLIDLLWDDSPPSNARAVVQSRISELRNILSLTRRGDVGCELATHGSGYILRISPQSVDAHQFRAMATDWRRGGSTEDARLALRGALDLWRGPALGGWLAGDSYNALCRGLESARLTATEDLFKIELQLGRHYQVVDELMEAASANLARERLVGLAMLALHRASRSADALRIYDTCRRWLSDELGADPGNDLQELHVAILHGTQALDHVPSETPAVQVSRPTIQEAAAATSADFTVGVPRLLPPTIGDFVGRAYEIAVIREVLTAGTTGNVAVVAVSGPGGVGKTALSVRAAQSLREEFPDGQLYADLHGVDETQALGTSDVIGRFLRALGVDGLSVPTTLEERAKLYRDLLADRRVLVVLDNARSDDQVLPLIPGTPSCGVLVNGRARLGATLGARMLSLEVLEVDQATSLLERIAGQPRVQAEPEAAGDLARHCGYLPLALRVVGAKLAAKPHWNIEKLVRLMSDERGRLDHFAHGHLDVRASIALSFTGLSAHARQLMRRLGDFDLPDVTVWACAALMGLSVNAAEDVLEELFDAQLIEARQYDIAGFPRYRLHDLVRLFAKGNVGAAESDAELVAARARLFGACLLLADTAYRAIYGGAYQNIWGTTSRWDVDDEILNAVAAQPLAWFEHERHVVVAAMRRAARDGEGAACWELACTTSLLFQMLRYFDEWQSVLDVALAAAQAAGDVRGQAAILHRLGGVCTDRGEHDRAWQLYRQAADMFEQIADRYGLANATALVAMIDRFRGDRATALDRYGQALPVLREAGDHGGVAWVLRNIGQTHLDLGSDDAAEECFQQALVIYQNTGSRQGYAQVLFWQSMLRLRQSRIEEAEAGFQQALATCRALGDRPGEAQSLRGLGICHQQRGDIERARATLSEALRLVRQPRPTLLEGFIRRTLAEL
ncbi:SARP family transcriptional regulator [Catellatospora sp. TT07R-123]|nr:SARP family transcriptional regulator [Catellatospora sp. TT07R-123]